MNKLILAVISIFLCSAAYAGPKKSLADLDKELKQAKSTETIMGLLGQLEQTVAETEADVVLLGKLMDQYPEQGRKAMARIKASELAKAVMVECDRQVTRMKKIRAKRKDALTAVDRQEHMNSHMNSTAMIGALANMKNKAAMPLLRGYLADPDLSRPASIALGRLGDEESLNGMVTNIEERGNVDLSGYGDKALAKIIEELGKPGLADKRKTALINQIKGGSSPERKRSLKELALKHPDEDVRTRSSLALVNSMFANPEEGDADFLYTWIPKAMDGIEGSDALLALRLHFPDKNRPLESRFVPVLLSVLNKSKSFASRSKAAQLLGRCNIKEALPQLKKCIIEDNDSAVRGECRGAYYDMTGEVPSVFHPNDARDLEERSKTQNTIEFYGKRSDNDPDKKYYQARLKALEEYRRNQAREQK
jgi:HEAT repeat protein